MLLVNVVGHLNIMVAGKVCCFSLLYVNEPYSCSKLQGVTCIGQESYHNLYLRLSNSRNILQNGNYLSREMSSFSQNN